MAVGAIVILNSPTQGNHFCVCWSVLPYATGSNRPLRNYDSVSFGKDNERAFLRTKGLQPAAELAIGSNGPVIVSADILSSRTSRRRSNLPPWGAAEYDTQRTHGRTGTSREASLPISNVRIGDMSPSIRGLRSSLLLLSAMKAGRKTSTRRRFHQGRRICLVRVVLHSCRLVVIVHLGLNHSRHFFQRLMNGDRAHGASHVLYVEDGRLWVPANADTGKQMSRAARSLRMVDSFQR